MKCPICQMKFYDNNTNESIISTACGHVFHKDCYMTWLQSNNSCPLCRKFCSESNILKLYLSPNFDDQEERITSESASFCASISEVQHKFDEISSIFGNFNLTYSSWEEKNKKLVEENESLKDRITGMQAETDDLHRKIRALENNSNLDNDNLPSSSGIAKNKKLIEENDSLQNLVAGMQAETDDLLEKIRVLESNLATEKSHFRELQELNENFRVAFTMWELKCKNLAQENESLKNRIVGMPADTDELLRKIRALECNLDTEKSNFRRIQESNKNFRETFNMFKEENVKFSEENKNFRLQITGMQAEKESLHKKIKDLANYKTTREARH